MWQNGLTMTSRPEVSNVPLQGAYRAGSCPVKAQLDVIEPADRLLPTDLIVLERKEGNVFESEIVAALLAIHPDAILIVRGGGTDPIDRAKQTLSAMQSGARLIIGGRIPADEIGRRVGEPDLLIASDSCGYHPVDIKNHKTLETLNQQIPGQEVPIASLAQADWQAHLFQSNLQPRPNKLIKKKDLLQLAHYRRMLEACEHAAPQNNAGIIGNNSDVYLGAHQITLYDLDAPIWSRKSEDNRTEKQSTMALYDDNFTFRLAAMAEAEAYKKDQTGELLPPVKIGECAKCEWWHHCEQQLEAGSGDVSLLPGIGWSEWKIHHDHGVTDRGALATLDIRTARLVMKTETGAKGINIPKLQAQTQGLEPDMPLTELDQPPSKKQAERLKTEGVETVSDLAELCPITATYFEAGTGSLVKHIDAARAAIGTEPIYRQRGSVQSDLKRFDIEVDVDMENNTEKRVYLWGALVTEPKSVNPEPTYHSFETWEPLTNETEAANSLRFWRWLTKLRSDAEAEGKTFGAYCYNASAENKYLNKLGDAVGISDEIDAFTQSNVWVDLLADVSREFVTGGSLGLKLIAPLAGYSWTVEDPGGLKSMLVYEDAINGDANQRQLARQWLLDYNKGDVHATLAVRQWLEKIETIPSIESFDNK